MKAKLRTLWSIARLLGLLAVLYGCAPLYDEILPTVRPEPVYDQLYPYYVEICAVSQIRAKFAEYGGSPGHAVMFLKGVCRDPDAPFPTIKFCAPDKVDLNDPESGVGISVNKLFKNVNWLTVPGKRLFFHGNLEAEQVLDKEHALETLEAAEKTGIFKGIEIHESYRPPEDDEQAQIFLAAKETLGTDFAINFGRTIFCARLPVTVGMLEDIITYLNDLNQEYALGEADYNWSGYHDNCSHVLHNSLAAAGVWPGQSVRVTKFRQLFNLSIPANEFADLAILANTYPLENFERLYNDRVKRESLLERNWLPMRHGALMKIIPVHANNELYDTRLRIFVLEGPLLRRKTAKIDKLFRQPHTTQVEANLRYFQQLYQKILEKRPAGWGRPDDRDEYQIARKKYYEYIREQLEDVDRKLAKLHAR